ncbi:hypothetical protein [Chryseobacterium sp. GP-SGM7]|uniref:hypothetical protein n=1 Tax=Chryseobacterium sp. GP-SGM7 TaxID=3411323 RepID=UPI003B945BDD
MGIIKKILLVYGLLLNLLFVKPQIVKLQKDDSIKLIKKDELKEDGLTFYKDEYVLTIYNKDNISFNKKNGYKYKLLAGGVRYCDKCKKESYGFIIKKIKSVPSQKYSVYSTNYLFKNINKYSFGGSSYFLIKGVYYKSLGMPIE